MVTQDSSSTQDLEPGSEAEGKIWCVDDGDDEEEEEPSSAAAAAAAAASSPKRRLELARQGWRGAGSPPRWQRLNRQPASHVA